LKHIIDVIRLDFKLKGIFVSFKRIQLPDTITPLGVIGSSLALKGYGLDQATQWQMKESEK